VGCGIRKIYIYIMLCHSLVDRMLCVNEESLSHTDLTKPFTMFSDGQGTVPFTCSVALACTSYLVAIKNCPVAPVILISTHPTIKINTCKQNRYHDPLFGNSIITSKLTCMSQCNIAYE